MIDKTLVKQRFRKNLHTYKDNCFVQQKMADRLVELIDFTPKRVLELGCGTGVLTEKLLARFSEIEYDAVDMVAECESYLPDCVNFIQCDIEKIKFDKKYDLIISNAVFQWVEDLESLIQNLRGYLADNGVILFSTFGEENFLEIKRVMGFGLSLQKLDNIVDEDIIKVEFNTPIEVLRHLKLTGVNGIRQQHWTKSNLSRFESEYPRVDGKCILTYHPIYCKYL